MAEAGVEWPVIDILDSTGRCCSTLPENNQQIQGVVTYYLVALV